MYVVFAAGLMGMTETQQKKDPAASCSDDPLSHS